MRLSPAPHRIIIKLKGNFNDTHTTDSGEKLQINTTYRPSHHVRIEAEVVGVPKNIVSNPIGQEYEGSPPPKHTASAPIHCLYHAKSKWYYAEYTDFDIKEGDKAYFHFNAVDFISNYNMTNRDSYLGSDEDGYEYHQMELDMVHCRIRDGDLKMLLGKILVKQLNEDKSEITLKGGIKTQGTVLKNGLITSIGDKSKYLEGIVHYIGEGVGTDAKETVLPGDKVMYITSSEFLNTIEEEEYYVMRQSSIISKCINGDYEPVGRYVKIETVNDDKFITPHGSTIREMKGFILEKGENCEGDYIIGDKVSFNSLSTHFVKYTNNAIFVREEDIYYKFKNNGES